MKYWERDEARLFVFAVVLCLIARGSSLYTATFNVDDLWFWPGKFDFQTLGNTALREGRFFGPVIVEVLTALGINVARTFTLSAVALLLCQSIGALMVCRLWKVNDDWRISAVVVAVLVLHPYQADISTWKIAQFPGGVPFVMTFWALLVCSRSAAWFALSAAVIVLALAIHQIPLEMAACVLAFEPIVTILRNRFDLREWVMRGLALGVATALYVVAAKFAISYTTHLESLGRESIILLSDPGLVFSRARELLSVVSLQDPLTGWLTRVLFIGLAIFGVFGIARRTEFSVRDRVLLVILLAVSVAAAFVFAISLTIVPLSWMPAFRNLLSVEVIWAGIAAVSVSLATGVYRRIAVSAVALILLGFIGSNNEVLSDQQRVNRRDLLMMNRIAQDIGHLDNQDKIRKIAFIGTTVSSLANIHTGADFSTGWHTYGTTLSIFAVWWPGYLAQLYNEVTGLTVFVATREQQAWAEVSCDGHRWPDQGSVFGKDDLAVVCLGVPAKVVPGPFDR
ncbi:hypothetical protein [Phyllobacterium chamaecytisi]|uniref:hypothetical protein n=1 Tax=Phyllobacterium chamaecytisi TaxID=2876082 RepID=UPI001CCA44F8|nr:hypothetical protein [Phyllobacterium sp. KW56]MBZ9600771.1 hypothetical protein [Phyllobacterium sp. KW56]